MWYVLQTLTGQEEELVRMVKKIIPARLYEDCFMAYHERIWRRQGQSIVHVERMFPGYVFIVSEDPKELFLELKRVPGSSKLLSDGASGFRSLEKGEEVFFQRLLGRDKVVKLSYLETDGKGHVHRVSGPLEDHIGQVVRYQWKKRYVIIRFQMYGIEKTASLGVILREDVQQELIYGKVELPVTVPEHYVIENARPGISDTTVPYRIGDHVKIKDGTLEGMEGMIWKVKKDAVEVGIHLLGQDVAIEVSADAVEMYGI